jgi:hypothetical protein
MSKQNKANKSNYDQAGRLSPDEMARERINQAQISSRAKSKENVIGKIRENGEQDSSRPRSAPEE